MDIATWVALGSLVLNLTMLPAIIVWKITRVETALRGEIMASRMEIDGKINNSRDDIEDKIDDNTRRFGETVAAAREHVNLEVATLRKEFTDEQKFCREELMRRDSFFHAQQQITSLVDSLGNDVKGWLERLERKLDSKHIAGAE